MSLRCERGGSNHSVFVPSSSLALIKCEKNFGVLAVRAATSLRVMG